MHTIVTHANNHTITTLRALITEVITEAARVAPPAELTALIGKLPMKVERTERGSWIASAKFSEKKARRARQNEQGMGEDHSFTEQEAMDTRGS